MECCCCHQAFRYEVLQDPIENYPQRKEKNKDSVNTGSMSLYLVPQIGKNVQGQLDVFLILSTSHRLKDKRLRRMRFLSQYINLNEKTNNGILELCLVNVEKLYSSELRPSQPVGCAYDGRYSWQIGSCGSVFGGRGGAVPCSNSPLCMSMEILACI